MDFDSLKNKAEELVEEHADQIDKGLDKAAQVAKDKFGHDAQVDGAVQKLKDVLPGGE